MRPHAANGAEKDASGEGGVPATATSPPTMSVRFSWGSEKPKLSHVSVASGNSATRAAVIVLPFPFCPSNCKPPPPSHTRGSFSMNRSSRLPVPKEALYKRANIRWTV